MSEVSITLKKNGPILVSGTVPVTAADGSPLPIDKPVFALCRCGHSANKPFCDGSHTREGFQPDGDA